MKTSSKLRAWPQYRTDLPYCIVQKNGTVVNGTYERDGPRIHTPSVRNGHGRVWERSRRARKGRGRV